ncbi:putative monosaccharide-transporting ATPase [Rosa chinensis]|uniref:Putative monosaccharide-transporting ATPase n=1 Tax=Rosa chinensis TaxID=74649 RepID=A0A2P6PUQ4_ROSCH|nr:putative monosaccharide-transporting ATPase [Rosa chinensis]
MEIISCDLENVGHSFHQSGSFWTDNGRAVFSTSSVGEDNEDDEEALKWEALQRLPTFTRLKKGLLTSPQGPAIEVDLHHLELQERKGLIERLVGVVEEDHENFLLRFKNRIDRVGISLPTIEVRFEHLNIAAESYIGGRALPTVFNYCVNLVEGFLNYLHIVPVKKQPLSILKDVSGIIKPCRMTLLLGPPSSGMTTLLLALAGELDKDLKVSGSVTYNGHDMHEFVPQRSAAYISQHDVHIGEMTVAETLAFSARCQGAGTRYEMLEELSRREKDARIKPDIDLDIYMKGIASESQRAVFVTSYILKILGLDGCADTLVGDQMIRGISGGQKKRVTTGEMLVGPAKALFMDEISTGLDSSTTYQIVNSIKQSVHILQGTAFISLLQPAPETYDLFDDIILLSEGQIVYQGPREYVLDFFESMGFRCPERKGVADFLQEVTSKKDQEQYWGSRDEPYRFITVQEFSEAFQSFHVGGTITNELATPFDKTKSHPAALSTNTYGVKKAELVKACLSREFLLMKRNSFVYLFKLTQQSILALITMTLFLRTKMHHDTVINGGLYAGALFFSLYTVVLNAVAEISMTVAKLPVFFKQRKLLFFPPWAYALPTWILKIPLTCVEVGVWVFISYYVIGYDPNVGRLFKQYLLLLLMHQMANALFKFIAGIGRSLTIANTLASFATCIYVALGGFILSRENIKKWWKWGYWISPLMYGQNAIVVNEFLGKSWRHEIPNSTESLGIAVLKSRGFHTHAYWYWIGAGALAGYMLFFNICYTLALTYLNQKGYGSTTHNTKRGMVLPFEPYSITFDEISYSVDMPQEMKNQGVPEDKLVLLRRVSGAFRPGVLTALMGVSGAGKTTLMDVLAGRKTGGYIEGNITISGHPKKQESFARISGYCEQNDIHSPHVTVYESLMYSAWLRLPAEIDSETQKMFVEEVMALVELDVLRHALVGLPGANGLSTEQRKRLTIAVELVANPSIIFMDEPTSGLDARAAAIVMRTVRNTVDTGRTVVCTIHQPSIDIFESFDELFLLKKGGQELYVGPLGRHSCHLIKYFEGIENVSKIKDGYNPATWMLEVTSSAKEIALGIDFADVYKKSELYRRNRTLIEELSTPPPGSKDLYFPTQYAQPFLTQCMACLWKQHWSYWRNPPYTAIKLIYTTMLALMLGTMFWDLGSKKTKQQDLFNVIGSMYATLLFLGIKNSTTVQSLVSVERTVFYRERAAGMYSPLAYSFAQVVIELPYVFAQTILYGVIVYAMIGLEWTTKFLWYLFFLFFTLLYFTFYGMMGVAVTPNLHVAAITTSAFYSLWNLFSGFLIPRTRIPIWWRWYYWVCPVAWSLYGLATSQFGDSQNNLETGETVEEFMRSYFGFKHEFLGVAAAVVVGFAVLFAFIFALAIKMLNFQRR